MLVVTANWAFSDGTLSTAAPVRPGLWLPAVHRAVMRAGFRRDGTYRPVSAVAVVLAGDTFDWLTSRAWTGDVRPWHGGARPRAARERLMLATVWRARRLLASLARWERHGMPVPTADRRGRPRPGIVERIPLTVTLLAGDRDRWLDAAAPASARHGCGVGRVWSDALVTVRHGDEFDPLCGDSEHRIDGPPGHPDRERQPTLGESLAVDLVARFGAAVADWSPALPAARRLVTLLARVSPRDIPAAFANWWSAADGGGPLSDAVRDRVLAAWRHAVSAWLREAHRLPPACEAICDPFAAWADWLDRLAKPGSDDGRGSGDGDLGRMFATIPSEPIGAALPPQVPAGGGPSEQVLGHLPVPGEGGGGRPICLGPPALRTSISTSNVRGHPHVTAGSMVARVRPPRPVTVTGLRTSAGMVWDWLEVEPDAESGTACPPVGGRERLRIVDAA